MMRKALAAAVLAALVLASVLAASGTVAAQDAPLRAPELVETGKTDRFGGGDWIVIRSGETLFGVLYGNEERPNSVVIFAEYRRYLGGAEIYDEQGDFLRRTGIPVRTVFSQRLDQLVEFTNTDGSGTFDFRVLNETEDHANRPVKVLNLRDAWTISDLSQERNESGLVVTFSLSLYEKPYDLIWDGGSFTPRHATPGDGVVEEITFSFRLTIARSDVTVENVPWYRVTVSDGRELEVLDSEFLESRTYEGVATSMGAKYDHYFQGWDFRGEKSRLALETHAIMGNFATKPVTQWLRAQYGDDVAHEDDGSPEHFRYREGDAPEEGPMLLTKDRIYFDDDWYRVGRLTWVSDVEVDGKLMRMAFQVHRAEPTVLRLGDRVFRGVALAGAYVYPAAEDYILHDPEFSAQALALTVPAQFNLVPGLTLLAQVAVIALAILAAVLISLTRRLRK
jgi:hypothetical protein